MTRSIFTPLNSSYLGFDSFFGELDRLLDPAANSLQAGGFPPYNVYKNGEDYNIEVAVAGFKDIDITIDHDESNGLLIITGGMNGPHQVNEQQSPNQQVVKQGIAARKFVRTFTISDNLKVESANLEHGLLTIWLRADQEITYQPRRIPLNSQAALAAPEGTTEKVMHKLTGSRKKAEEPA
jgi:molecular chaperone IbpA